MLTSQNADRHNSYRERALCSAVIGTMTMTLKAQRLLAQHAIRVDVTKIHAEKNQKGCVYGIEYPCVLAGNIRAVLYDAGISIKSP